MSQRDGRVDRERLIGAGLVLLLAWCAGTVAGVLGGSALGDPEDYGLDAMFPALFLALMAGQLGDRRRHAAAYPGRRVADDVELPAGDRGAQAAEHLAGNVVLTLA